MGRFIKSKSEKIAAIVTVIDDNGDQQIDPDELRTVVEALFKAGVEKSQLIEVIGTDSVLSLIGRDSIEAELIKRDRKAAQEQVAKAVRNVNRSITAHQNARLNATEADRTATQAVQDRDKAVEVAEQAEAELKVAQEIFDATLGKSKVFASAKGDIEDFEFEVNRLIEEANSRGQYAAQAVNHSANADRDLKAVTEELSRNTAAVDKLVTELAEFLTEEQVAEATELVAKTKKIFSAKEETADTDSDELDVPEFVK